MAVGKDLTAFEERIGYRFSDSALLEQALTHSSYCFEAQSRGLQYPSNERLEFLGDAVLQLTASSYLFRAFPRLDEGRLTRMRQFLVCEKTLASIADSLSLGSFLHLGHGEENDGFRARPKVLADALEAVFAAIYLDGGESASSEVILRLFVPLIPSAEQHKGGDYKTALQVFVEKDGSSTLEYRILAEAGPEHNKEYTVEAVVNNNRVGIGIAKTKKRAEMLAAKEALRLFGLDIS